MQLHQLFYPWLHSHGNVWILYWRLTTKMTISYFCLRNDLKEWWLTFLFHLPETWGRRGIFPPWFSFPNCCGALRNLGITPSSRRHLFSSPAQKVPLFCAILPCSERRDFYGRISEVNVLLDFFCMNLARVKRLFSVNSTSPQSWAHRCCLWRFVHKCVETISFPPPAMGASSSSGCPESHPTCPWAFPCMGQPQLLCDLFQCLTKQWNIGYRG